MEPTSVNRQNVP